MNRVLCFLAISCFASSSTRADIVLFDNGVTLPTIAGGFVADVLSSGYVGDDFSISFDATLRTLRWTGYYPGRAGNLVPPPNPDFTIQFYDNSGSSPALAPLVEHNVGSAVTRTDTGARLFSIPIFEYTTTIPDTNLVAGDYLLSIFNDTPSDFADRFNWMSAATGNGSFFRSSNLGINPWIPHTVSNPTAGNFDFQISGAVTVPEPSTYFVCLAGMVAFTIRRRRGRYRQRT